MRDRKFLCNFNYENSIRVLSKYNLSKTTYLQNSNSVDAVDYSNLRDSIILSNYKTNLETMGIVLNENDFGLMTQSDLESVNCNFEYGEYQQVFGIDCNNSNIPAWVHDRNYWLAVQVYGVHKVMNTDKTLDLI